MARTFLTSLDLSQNELLNARIQNLSTTQINNIAAPVEGQFVYDTTLNVLKVYDGSGWSVAGGAATGAGAPSSTPTSVGALYWDTTNYVLYVSKGTSSSADWVPNDPRGATGDMAAASLSTANSAGTSIKVAPIDHVHRHTDTDHSGIHLNALASATGDYSMGGNKLTNVGTPVNNNDAANKEYVDAVAEGLHVHPSVVAATTANLTATYNNGTSGVGATLTNSGANVALALDGVSLSVSDRVLVKNQTAGEENGIYTVTVVGDGSTSWVLTRATDMNTSAEVDGGDFVFITGGTLYDNTGWVQTATGVTIGTTPIVWEQFSGAGTYTAGNGLTLTGTTFAVGTASATRIVVNADDIDLATVSQTNTTGTAGVSFVQSQTIDSYGRVTGTVTASVQDATTSAKGIASFDSADFSVTSGAVSVKSGGIDNAQLANSSVTLSNGTNITVTGSPLSLGGTATIGLSGEVAIVNGGTGANSAAAARANLGATTKVTGTNSAGATTTVNHGLGQWVLVQLFDTTTGAQVEADITNASTSGGTTTITFSVSQSAGAYTYVIIG